MEKDNLMPPRPVGVVEIDDKKYTLSIGNYMNGNLAVMLHGKDGEPYAVVSRNVPSIPIEGDQFFVGMYDLTPKIMDGLSKCGFFEDTGARVRPDGSHVELPLWEVKAFLTAKMTQAYEE